MWQSTLLSKARVNSKIRTVLRPQRDVRVAVQRRVRGQRVPLPGAGPAAVPRALRRRP